MEQQPVLKVSKTKTKIQQPRVAWSQDAVAENEGKTPSDIAELTMEDTVDCYKEESAFDKITKLQKIIDEYPELSIATEKRLIQKIKDLKNKIDDERVINPDVSADLSQWNLLKEVQKGLVFQKSNI